MVIDTSAIVAILANEPDASIFLEHIERATTRQVGAHVRLECTVNIARILGLEFADAETFYDDFLATAAIEVMPITDAVSRLSVDAYARFGKGRGHPARLNFADCLSYACAASAGASLLFKGNDFNRTDIQAVT